MGVTLPVRSADDLQTERLESRPVVVTARRDQTIETPGDDRLGSTSAFRLKRNIHFHHSERPVRTQVIAAPKEDYFKAIRNWEGVVEDIGDTTFTATMRDMADPDDRGEEIFEFELEDIDIGDRDLLAPGAIFYFTLGYKIDSHQTRYKGTRMMFRRLPEWSKRDIERIDIRAEQLLNQLQTQPAE